MPGLFFATSAPLEERGEEDSQRAPLKILQGGFSYLFDFKEGLPVPASSVSPPLGEYQ